jgi:hypothetical protein
VTRVAAALCALWLLLPATALGAASIRADVSSSETSVGRPFDYVVRATLESEDDARRARIVAPIGAFEAVGPATQERDGREVRLTQRLACLGPGCVPRRDTRVVPFAPARVELGARTTTAEPASIAVVPRVPEAVVASRNPGYVRQTGIPPPGFPVQPDVLAALAAALALALALGAVAIVATGLRARRRETTVDVDPYDRAVRLLRESASRSDPDRRRAAGLLGRVARKGAGDGLASTADRVAWSRPQPDAASVGGLADRAETERP